MLANRRTRRTRLFLLRRSIQYTMYPSCDLPTVFDLLHKEAQRDPGFVSSVAFIELQLRVCTQQVKRNAQVSTNPIEKCKPRPLNRLILTGWSYIK